MKTKRWTALVLIFAMVFCLAGCFEGVFPSVVTIDGQEISSGTYLFLQWVAYREASQLVEYPQRDVLKQTITETEDDVETVTDADDWIKARTLELLLNYVTVKKIAAERGIVLTEANQKAANSATDSNWSSSKVLFEKNGVSKEVVRDYFHTMFLNDQLFDKLYLDGGERQPTQEELAEKYAELYAHARYNTDIFMMQDQETGEDLETAEAAREALEDLVKRLNNGELTFNDAMRYDVRRIHAILDPKMYGDPEEIEETPAEFDDDGEEIMPEDLATMFIDYTPDSYDIYSEEFLAGLKVRAVGTFDFYEVQGMVLLYEKIDIFEDEDDYLENRDAITREAMQEDFEDYLKSIYAEFSIEWVFGARSYYSLGKVTIA